MKSLISYSKICLGLLTLTLVSQAHAYKPMCEHLFDPRFESDAALAPQSAAYAEFINKYVSSKKVLDAMAEYQKVMGFETIDQKASSLDLVKQRFAKLSPEQKQQMMTLVHDNYNDVKLLKYSKDGPVKYFKRHLDVMVSENLHVRSWFKYMIEERHASIEKTFDLYFKRVQELTDAPITLEGSDVLLSALRLKEKFLEKGKQKGPIVIYGSFVNGRAYEKTSDMDFAVTDARLEQMIRETDTVSMLEEFPFSDASAHVITPKQVQGLGYMNPVVVIVREKIIEVRVYDSGPDKAHQSGKVPFDAYYF